MHILLESITVGFVLDAKTESNTCRGDRFCRLCPCEAESLFELFYRKTALLCSTTVAITGFLGKVAYGIFLKKRKSYKKTFVQTRFLDTGFLTSLCFFLPIKFLKSNWRFICQRLMGPLFVIEAHIFAHAFSKIRLR